MRPGDAKRGQNLARGRGGATRPRARPLRRLLRCLGGSLLGGKRLGGGNLLGFDARLLGGGGLALVLVQAAGAGARILADARGFAAAVTQIVELGAADAATAHDLDALYQRRIDREDALDAFTIGDLAHGEALVEARARARDAHAFIGLDTGTRTFGDAH